MLFATGYKNPSLTFRLTAVIAALLVAALSVFAASPTLHAWLHGHEKDRVIAQATPDTSAAASHATPDHGPDDHDDGCAITLFAAGVLAVCSALLAWLFVGRVRTAFVWPALHVPARARRYWLPPLCGPPAS